MANVKERRDAVFGADPHGCGHACGVGRAYDHGFLGGASLTLVDQERLGVVAGDDGTVVEGGPKRIDDLGGGKRHQSHATWSCSGPRKVMFGK